MDESQLPSPNKNSSNSSYPEQPISLTDVGNLPENTTTTNKKFSKKLIFITGLTCLIIAAILSFLIVKNKAQHDKQLKIAAQKIAETTTVDQVFINPVDGSKTQINITDYFSITVGSIQYYGRVSKINDNYLRLDPTAYKKSETLIFSGNELHGPEQYTYFNLAKISKLQKLNAVDADDSPIIDFLKTFKSKSLKVNDAFPSHTINNYIKNDHYQAFFFADGSSYFSKTASLNGTFLANTGHVFLTRTDNVTTSTGSIPQVSLALATHRLYDMRTANDLLFWQNLNPDSKITLAALSFEKQNQKELKYD